MCGICGCDGHVELPARATVARTLDLAIPLLAKNDALAEANRARLARGGMFAVNVMGSPGAGKTALLERVIVHLREHELRVGVLEGDQATALDAERIRAAGCDVLQINTGAGCHLDAHMVAAGLGELGLPDGSLLFVENVGNLVCPALFDLGEQLRVVVMSVTEGEDKPLKYPPMFRAAHALVLNKIDLLPHLSFDVERCKAHALQVNPKLEILQVSATRGDGLHTLSHWLADEARADRRAP